MAVLCVRIIYSSQVLSIYVRVADVQKLYDCNYMVLS
jgi:hypothetical protein